VPKKADIKHIIYMSVQGAGENKFIPHHTIENIIESSGIDFTFLRPAYFMQNFVTTLKGDIANRLIYLPASNAKFSLVDIRDIASVTSKIVLNLSVHNMQKYDLTSDELLNFEEMTSQLNQYMDRKIKYQSPNPIMFALTKLKAGQKISYILVLIMLHYLPRFQKPPVLSNSIFQITGQKPLTFNQFATDYQSILKS
jgi:uncharacterized protein YbjT (DUF2867 family)